MPEKANFLGTIQLVENDHFRAFFGMVLQKLAFSGKRGLFRAKSHEIKVVENAILKTFYSMTFFVTASGSLTLSLSEGD